MLSVDLTPLLPGIPRLLQELEVILESHRTVAALEHMKWLGAFMCIGPVHASLVGAATTEEEAFALVQEKRPSLLVVSQALEKGTGLSLVERTEKLDGAITTLLVVDDYNYVLVRDALAVRCDGICFNSEEFMPALRVVAGGGVYYPKQVAKHLQEETILKPQPFEEPLTAREKSVLKALMLGLSDNQISTRFVISTETVKTHVKHIYRKLGVNNRTKAVVKSIAAGLISLEEALNDNLAMS